MLAALALSAPALPAAAAPSASSGFALVPSHDGHVGAWLLSTPQLTGPGPEQTLDLGRPGAGERLPRPWGGSWSAQADRGPVDLARRAGSRAGTRLFAAARLELTAPLEGWLLLSVDGPATLFVDGRRHWTRRSDGLRGRSWDPIPIELEPGQHTIVLSLEHPGQHWALDTRVVERRSLRAPPRARWTLAGVDARTAERIGAGLLTARLDLRASADGYAPRLELAFPRGMPASFVDRPIRIEASWPRARSAASSPDHVPATPSRQRVAWSVGAMPGGPGGVVPHVIKLPEVAASDLAVNRDHYTLGVALDSSRYELRAPLEPEVIELSSRLERQRQRLTNAADDAFLSRALLLASIEYWRLVLRGEAAAGAPTAAAARVPEAPRALATAREAVEAARELLLHLESDRDPLRVPGVHALASSSIFDGRPQPLWLHVPSGMAADPDARRPLVLLLHGYDGHPRGIMEAFLDTRSRAPRTGVNGFVAAPHAHGNAFYRGPGERAVMDALDALVAALPVDEDRVTVSGVSMGGTGAAHIALRYADRFAAAAPLCGYHSYFHRRDTSNRPLRDWERSRMHHFSPASWAANGRGLPLYVAHGLQDFPLENSRVLIDAYRELGYQVEEEWPDTGHSVWLESYAGARLWPWLTSRRRERAPRHVTIQTDSLRYGRSFWAAITRLAEPGTRGLLDARIDSNQSLQVRTAEIEAFSLRPPAELLDRGEPRRVEIDGAALAVQPGEHLDFVRDANGWRRGSPAGTARHKRAGSEGPIFDAFLDPLVFVYGTGSSATRAANREVARALARYRTGLDLELPIIADTELTPELVAQRHLVLVGNEADHAVLRRIAARLPIRIDGHGITIELAPAADRQRQRERVERLAAPELGAMFVHPNPENPGRYVVVVTAPSVTGIWRALSLPRLLPDYVVYDARLAAASDEQVLGKAEILRAGFFDRAWRVSR